jgi:protease-4
MLSLLRPFTDEERAFMKKSMENVYEVFASRVTAARGEKVVKLDEVAQGRLFTGIQAKEVGLVDDVGTLHDAVKAAAKSVGLGDNYQVLVLPEPKSFADILREGLLADVRTPITLGGVKFDAVAALLSSLPADLRTPTERALRLLKTLDSEHILLAMPAGLVETSGAKK